MFFVTKGVNCRRLSLASVYSRAWQMVLPLIGLEHFPGRAYLEILQILGNNVRPNLGIIDNVATVLSMASH